MKNYILQLLQTQNNILQDVDLTKLTLKQRIAIEKSKVINYSIRLFVTSFIND